MPRKGERWTAQERIFVNNVAMTGDKVYAATKAGYKQPDIAGYAIAAKPVIKAEIARREEEILFNEILPIAIKRHKKMLMDDKTPPGAQAQLIKLAYDRTLGVNDDSQHKEPHEMTSDEIAKAIGQLEAVAFARAKPVLELESAQGAQQVRSEDVFS
jgi:phage terminase small subunit